ncbi:DUF5694 domain-containing protein [Kangiella spongicola]|uniref:DUF5694 domain-containing protein n=1 Tax=Kangiella spongicola TaxID=796379 RepID=UPI0018C72CA1|nr:DUF5694 domain-containing protein [Kangiella spongicola]
MRTLIVIAITLLMLGCSYKETQQNSYEKKPIASNEHNKIPVLNVGTFHFGYTPDAHSTEFDEESETSKKQAREVAKLLAQFKPTIIVVEKLPKYDDELNQAYQEYLKNPAELITKDGEISMIAFEVGRLSNVEKLYGIDNHMGYNYSVGDYIERTPELTNSIDPHTYLQITNDPYRDHPEIAEREKQFNQMSLLEKLKLFNEPAQMDYSINTNADKLLYVGIDDGFEGADNAAIFYQRNMRIYSNLNRIPMTKDDRVFILMGRAHTAFLREFIKRSPKFEMVDTLKYLEEY